MSQPEALYTWSSEVMRELVAVDEPVAMIHILQGFVDAGHAGQLAADHLLTQFPHRRLATFDLDDLLNYRARRPVMTFDATTWSSYRSPELAIDVLEDANGQPFLLMHGPEPDLRWEGFCAAVIDIVTQVGVSPTIRISGIPMSVPHTRPLELTAHGTRPGLVVPHPPWLGRVSIPGNLAALLEIRLGENGHDAVGFAVHVPHYLATSQYPQASATLLEQVEMQFDLDLCLERLEPQIRAARAEIEAQVQESAHIRTLVASLEDQYDRTRSRRRSAADAVPQDWPSAEEIARELQAFLADQLDSGKGPEGPGEE